MKTIQVEFVGSMHGNLLSEPWYESDDCMTRQAASDGQQVCIWHDRSYIAGIPLLAHGLTVKLRPCQCSRNSPAGQIAACLCGPASLLQSATHSGSPQDDSAPF